jgi:hypothetical protein
MHIPMKGSCLVVGIADIFAWDTMVSNVDAALLPLPLLLQPALSGTAYGLTAAEDDEWQLGSLDGVRKQGHVLLREGEGIWWPEEKVS